MYWVYSTLLPRTRRETLLEPNVTDYTLWVMGRVGYRKKRKKNTHESWIYRGYSTSRYPWLTLLMTHGSSVEYPLYIEYPKYINNGVSQRHDLQLMWHTQVKCVMGYVWCMYIFLHVCIYIYIYTHIWFTTHVTHTGKVCHGLRLMYIYISTYMHIYIYIYTYMIYNSMWHTQVKCVMSYVSSPHWSTRDAVWVMTHGSWLVDLGCISP